MEIKEIGMIHSEFDRSGNKKPPKQGQPSDGNISVIEIFPEFSDALMGLEEIQYIDVLFWADQADRSTLQAKIQGVGPIKGVFRLRAPHRPNPILLSTCKILSIDGNKVTVDGLDALDKSKLIDIKIHVKRPI